MYLIFFARKSSQKLYEGRYLCNRGPEGANYEVICPRAVTFQTVKHPESVNLCRTSQLEDMSPIDSKEVTHAAMMAKSVLLPVARYVTMIMARAGPPAARFSWWTTCWM